MPAEFAGRRPFKSEHLEGMVLGLASGEHGGLEVRRQMVVSTTVGRRRKP